MIHFQRKNSTQFSIISSEGRLENEKERLRRKFNIECHLSMSKGCLTNYDLSAISFSGSVSEISRNAHSTIDNGSNNMLEWNLKNTTSSSQTKMNLNCIQANLEKDSHLFGESIQINDEDNYYNICSSNRTGELAQVSDKEIKSINIAGRNNKIVKFAPTSKIGSLFNHDSKSDIASMNLLDDEHSVRNKKYQNCQKEYKFIRDIKKTNFNIEKINLERILDMNIESFFILFSFIFDISDLLCGALPQLRGKIQYLFNKKFSYIIENFQKNYSKYLDIEGFFFSKNQTRVKKIIYPTFDLVIQCGINDLSEKVLSKGYCDISYEISYNFRKSKVDTKRDYMEIFKFDIRSDKKYPIWFASEFEEFRGLIKRFLYTTPVQVFRWGDKAILRINLFQKDNIIISNIRWNPIKIEKVEKEFYEKKEMKNEIFFDQIRSCEIENMIRFWKKGNYTKLSKAVKEIIKIFSKNFKIDKIYCDILRFTFYKIKMKAEKIGKIISSNFMNCLFEIVEENASIINECVNIGCVNNLSNLKKVFQVRKGTIIILYIMDYDL